MAVRDFGSETIRVASSKSRIAADMIKEARRASAGQE
jgi:hypothetical protein